VVDLNHLRLLAYDTWTSPSGVVGFPVGGPIAREDAGLPKIEDDLSTFSAPIFFGGVTIAGNDPPKTCTTVLLLIG